MTVEQVVPALLTLYLRIEETGASTSGKTKIFTVFSRSSDNILGYVKWYAPWRQYCFFPAPESLYNVHCLECLAGFCQSYTQFQKGTE